MPKHPHQLGQAHPKGRALMIAKSLSGRMTAEVPPNPTLPRPPFPQPIHRRNSQRPPLPNKQDFFVKIPPARKKRMYLTNPVLIEITDITGLFALSMEFSAPSRIKFVDLPRRNM